MPMLASRLSIRHVLSGAVRNFQPRPAFRFASTGQSSKLRVVPFALKPAVALAKFKSVASDYPGVSVFGLNPSYWPIWRVDAIFEKDKVVVDGQVKEGSAYLAIQGAYLPGAAEPGMSEISYANTVIPDDLPLYNRREHCSQLGGRVKVRHAWSFSVSPFAAVKEMRKTFAALSTAGGFSQPLAPILDEARWKEKLLVGYPIYMPVYSAVCSYRDANGQLKIRFMLIWAHDSRLITLAPCAFETSEISPENEPDPDELYTSWLAPSPPKTGKPSPLQPATGRITWKDPRIQDWVGAERKENTVYIGMASKVHQVAKLVEHLADDLEHGKEDWLEDTLLNAAVALMGGKSHGRLPSQLQVGPGVKESLVKSAERKLWNMERELLEMKPAWLVEREAAKPGRKR